MSTARYKSSLLQKISYLYSVGRSAGFTLQAMPLPWLERIVRGEKRDVPKNYYQHLLEAIPKIDKLLQQDSYYIAKGVYPLQVLKPESFFEHSQRIPKILLDTVKVAKRRHKKMAHDFKNIIKEEAQDLPDYYKRNFHFQTDGYLSDLSADLYEHQVEILFSGAADAMRRSLLAPLKQRLNSADGKGLKFLELGSGTGRMTRFMALTFPQAQITALDLSVHYNAMAKERLSEFRRVDVVTGKAEETGFQNESFDVVYSCFLFHELPLEVRAQVLKETYRLLKSEGCMGFVDSLQTGDDTELDWALEQFPKDFHEPFYRNYVQTPMGALLNENGFEVAGEKTAFLSKSVLANKK